MVALTGKLLEARHGSVFSPNRNPFYNTGIDVNSAGEAHLTTQDIEKGTLTKVTRTTIKRALTGNCRFSSFKDIFYNRFEIQPNPLQVGNITSDQTFTLRVWNGFFVNRTLDQILSLNLDGITLSGISTPNTFGPLEEINITVNVDVDTGPPTINGTFTFDFEAGINNIVVPVTGSRVLPFPYMFQPGNSETLIWNTQIITSNNGYEQRVRLRNAPRQQFSVDIALPMDEATDVDYLLYAWRPNNFAVPVWSECRLTTAPTATDSPNIAANTDFGDFRAGGLAILYNNPKDFELIEIESFTQNEIVASTNISKVFPAGTFVAPVMPSRLLSDPIRRTDGNRTRIQASFESATNQVLPSSASTEQYKGLDVFLTVPLLEDEFLSDTYTSRVDVLDFETGIVSMNSPWDKTKTRRNFRIESVGAQEIWEFKQWLHRRGGRQRPFWAPTFEPNFELLSVGALDVQLIVANRRQDTLSPEREDIAIETTSGWIFREVSSITPIGNDLEVTVTASVGVDASIVENIYFMGRKRLGSDRIEIVHSANYVGDTVLPILEINN